MAYLHAPQLKKKKGKKHRLYRIPKMSESSRKVEKSSTISTRRLSLRRIWHVLRIVIYHRNSTFNITLMSKTGNRTSSKRSETTFQTLIYTYQYHG
ncbi:Hypothetical protein CGLY_16445 (plasmid) [Corynebacterium glyciniphilum AJ 3170]|uniref:Uncharacterized protein n=1 Tax=Corynebacterium glyciniphilum AJ 3170 TaxID=1404245 RepID=X5DYG4_9CORY|nr:Hypothetical protein CGLY_16445 [Corynebacterium glyciniphilum AJ 3170]